MTENNGKNKNYLASKMLRTVNSTMVKSMFFHPHQNVC